MCKDKVELKEGEELKEEGLLVLYEKVLGCLMVIIIFVFIVIVLFYEKEIFFVFVVILGIGYIW